MNNEVYAVVAGKEITESDVQNLIASYPPEQRIYMTSPNAKSDLVEQLITFQLFANLAEEQKIQETEEFQKMLEKVKVEIASNIAATNVVKDIAVSNEEESKYYNDNKARFVKGATVRAKHILVDTVEKANQIREEIAAGKSFEDAAREYSTCPSKESGGDLGEFGKGQMVPPFEKAAFEAELNTVVGPVETQFGQHLILVEEKKEESVTPFEYARPQIHDELIQIKQQEVYSAKVKELEEKYGVERKLS